MASARVTHEMMMKAATLTRSGMTIQEAADRLGVPRSTLSEHMRKAGYSRHKKTQQWTQEQIDRAVEMRLEGYSTEIIADEVGMGHTTVKTKLLELGVKPPHGLLRRRPDPEYLAKASEEKRRVEEAPKPIKMGERDSFYRSNPDLLKDLGKTVKTRSQYHDIPTLARLMGLHPSTIQRAVEAA